MPVHIPVAPAHMTQPDLKLPPTPTKGAIWVERAPHEAQCHVAAAIRVLHGRGIRVTVDSVGNVLDRRGDIDLSNDIIEMALQEYMS